jgi:hypothetical protein
MASAHNPPLSLEGWIPNKGEDDIIALGIFCHMINFSKNHLIIIPGAQECTYKPRKGFTTCEEDWFHVVKKHLREHYVPLAQVSLRDAIRLIVFVKKTHLPKISYIEVL